VDAQDGTGPIGGQRVDHLADDRVGYRVRGERLRVSGTEAMAPSVGLVQVAEDEGEVSLLDRRSQMRLDRGLHRIAVVVERGPR
jgi:hypothetical protein